MGTFAVWELAALLRDASKSPVQVIAPPPQLSAWVNDKIAFAEVVTRLFGPEFVPRTLSAWNLATLAQRVRDLACSSRIIGIKLPTRLAAMEPLYWIANCSSESLLARCVKS